MKQFLLLSLMATAGITASAVQPVAETTEKAYTVANSEQLQTMAPEVETIACDANQSQAPTKAVIKAETAAKPYYYLPGGAFMESYGSGLGWTYFYYTTASGTRYEHPIAVPSYQNLDWNYHQVTNTAVPTDSIIWQYRMLTPNASGGYSIGTNQVEKATSITTPAYPYGYGGWGTPIMASANGANPALYSFGDVQMAYARSELRSSTKGLMHLTYARYNAQMTTETKITDQESDSLIISPYYTNYLTSWKDFGFYIPKPNGMYGIHGVNFIGVPFNYISEKFSFSVYKVASRKSNIWATYNTQYYTYELGEKIGEGYVPGDSLQNFNKKHVLFIPVKETIGDFEMDSYLNIDTDVVIMFEGYTQKLIDGKLQNDGDRAIPDVLCTFNPRFENEVVYLDPQDNVYKSGNNTRLNSVGFPTYLMSGVNLVMGTLAAYDDADYYTFNAATAGESKTFEFEPSMDLNDEDGQAYIDGEGAFDWYDFTVNNIDATTGVQTITVKVNALPAGATGRTSDLLVKIPGAQQVIKITQGEVSGIDNVSSNNAVVSSSYFDLMGRQLNAEPETGLFIRQDVKADGSKVATKVVK